MKTRNIVLQVMIHELSWGCAGKESNEVNDANQIEWIEQKDAKETKEFAVCRSPAPCVFGLRLLEAALAHWKPPALR